jgi:hypothetical protein
LGFKAAPKSSHLLKPVYQFSIAALCQFTSAPDTPWYSLVNGWA